MSIKQTLRASGTVVDVRVQEGVKNGNAWKIVTCRVLVGKSDLAEVQLGASQPTPKEGDQIDWRVEIDDSNRQYGAQLRAIGPWVK